MRFIDKRKWPYFILIRETIAQKFTFWRKLWANYTKKRLNLFTEKQKEKLIILT